MVNLFLILGEVSTFAALLPILAGIKSWGYHGPTRRAVWLICVTIFAAEQLARYYWLRKEPNLWVYHSLAPLLAVGWCWVYHQKLRPVLPSRVVLALGVLFIPLAIANALWWQLPAANAFNSNVTTPLSGMMVIFALIYFRLQFTSKPLAPIKGNYMLWINSANLLYWAGSLFLFVITQYLVQGDNIGTVAFVLNACFNLINMALLAIALWMKPPNP
ncbi:MAG: hypothetical protein AAFQ98_00145 [Bacteroidota bacterium]